MNQRERGGGRGEGTDRDRDREIEIQRDRARGRAQVTCFFIDVASLDILATVAAIDLLLAEGGAMILRSSQRKEKAERREEREKRGEGRGERREKRGEPQRGKKISRWDVRLRPWGHGLPF